MNILGLVDLGQHTPANQVDQLGDHALVFMFQPFRRTWVQTLRSFLSKGCTPGSIMKELTLECISKLEDTGLFVDIVTTDGATWNRKMWTDLGINKDNACCKHPFDDNRNLWFNLIFHIY